MQKTTTALMFAREQAGKAEEISLRIGRSDQIKFWFYK